MRAGGYDRTLAARGKKYVALELNSRGAKQFEELTSKNVNRRLAIVLDNTVYSAPVIQERISGGNAQITGNFTMDEAKDLIVGMLDLAATYRRVADGRDLVRARRVREQLAVLAPPQVLAGERGAEHRPDREGRLRVRRRRLPRPAASPRAWTAAATAGVNTMSE